MRRSLVHFEGCCTSLYANWPEMHAWQTNKWRDTLPLYCSAEWYFAANTHLKLLDCVISGAWFLTMGVFSVTLQISDLWQYYVWCIKSGVTKFTLFMALYLSHMCHCMLHAVLWSHINLLMHFLGEEARSTAWVYSTLSIYVKWFSWPCIWWCGTGSY